MELYQNKNLLCAKRSYQQSEDTTYRMEKIFSNYSYDKGLISTIYKELKKLAKNHQIKNEII
jgi:hypothetical protein